jgi:uncharacterized protein YukE
MTSSERQSGAAVLEKYTGAVDALRAASENEGHGVVGGAVAGLGTAADIASFAANPLAGVLSAGVGWLIEHIGFIKEPLDHLLGDPAAIQGATDQLNQLATDADRLAQAHAKDLQALQSGWAGDGADAFHASMDQLDGELAALSKVIEGTGAVMSISGGLVVALRDIVVSAIADCIGQLIAGALVAAASAVITFGVSVAVYAGVAAIRAAALVAKLASKIAQLVAALARIGDRVGLLTGMINELTSALGRFSQADRPISDTPDISTAGSEAEALQPMDSPGGQAPTGRVGGGEGGGGFTGVHQAEAAPDAQLPEAQGLTRSRMAAEAPMDFPGGQAPTGGVGGGQGGDAFNGLARERGGFTGVHQAEAAPDAQLPEAQGLTRSRLAAEAPQDYGTAEAMAAGAFSAPDGTAPSAASFVAPPAPGTQDAGSPPMPPRGFGVPSAVTAEATSAASAAAPPMPPHLAPQVSPRADGPAHAGPSPDLSAQAREGLARSRQAGEQAEQAMRRTAREGGGAGTGPTTGTATDPAAAREAAARAAAQDQAREGLARSRQAGEQAEQAMRRMTPDAGGAGTGATTGSVTDPAAAREAAARAAAQAQVREGEMASQWAGGQAQQAMDALRHQQVSTPSATLDQPGGLPAGAGLPGSAGSPGGGGLPGGAGSPGGGLPDPAASFGASPAGAGATPSEGAAAPGKQTSAVAGGALATGPGAVAPQPGGGQPQAGGMAGGMGGARPGGGDSGGGEHKNRYQRTDSELFRPPGEELAPPVIGGRPANQQRPDPQR